ncbi:MAG: LOG family protein [Christensenellaceae bacterium]|jgi:uncharacterized protein (TIGR00730 family)|nr:LOG family protein [Christensenellaceae bacterium]
MKVCVCGGTNPATNPKWLGFASELGDLLCKNDFEMVWGGNAFGVLSNIHQQYIDQQKENTLFLPEAYKEDLNVMKTDKVEMTKLVVERTHAMLKSTNVVIIVPGGIGTIYEFWTAVEGLRAGEYDLDIIMLNYKGFYKNQLEHFKFINENGFTKTGKGGAPYKIKPEDLFTVVDTPEKAIEELKKIRKKRG